LGCGAMHFSRAKIAIEESRVWRKCPIDTVGAYALMLAPVYVRMEANQKYVAVKAPLDFFTPAELSKYAKFGHFYFTEAVDQSLVFRETGRKIRAVLSWNAKTHAGDVEPTNYELSDASLRLIAPLWGPFRRIEPFFVTTLINEICEPITPEALEKARDLGVDQFELAIARSSWAAFLGLHLGYVNLAHLSDLRRLVFEQNLEASTAHALISSEQQGLEDWVKTLLPSLARAHVDTRSFSERPDLLAKKITSRLERIEREQMIKEDATEWSIFGKKGFVEIQDGVG
jgi:hypothetical protein